MGTQKAFQDYFPGNLCNGCGPYNPLGLKLKTYWAEGEECAVTMWRPDSFHCAAFEDLVHGPTVLALLDCPGAWTATAEDYRWEGRELGTLPLIIYVTGTFGEARFEKKIPTNAQLTICSRVLKRGGKSRVVRSELFVDGERYARQDNIFVRDLLDENRMRRLLDKDAAIRFFEEKLRKRRMLFVHNQ